MNEAKFLTIRELLEHINRGQLELPNIQRGFVWRPSQIENLWDSLLRGFPSGAIITSPIRNDSYQLLDGQQRTTSIALGCTDPHENQQVDVLRSSSSDIRIFVDMRKPKSDDEGKAFAFRVITRSHPWGYQNADNTKTLEANNKSKALELWGRGDPFEDDVLSSVYPWDAAGPLPLNFFTHAALQGDDLETLKQDLLGWVQARAQGTTKDSICTWLEDFKSLKSGKPPHNHFTYSVEEIYEKVKAFVLGYTIPMQPLSRGIALSEDYEDVSTNTPAAKHLDGVEEFDGEDEIEQIFVRLNSGGTILGGEELNYSIIKSKIDREFQERIESGCQGIMKPARFITIAFRLYQKSIYEDSINLRIKPKQFQREMRRPEEFKKFIDERILKYGLLSKVQSALRYGDETLEGYDKSVADYRLPYPLFLKVAAASQGEVMFLLMYRLLFGVRGNSDSPDEPKYDTSEHRRMIGIILMFMWHGKDARGRYNKLLEKVWASVKEFPFAKMWSADLVAVAKGDNELKAIPKDGAFLNLIKNVQKNTKIWDRCRDSEYSEFIDNVMCNRDLLLWVQRKFLSTSPFFKENLFRLDETDVPFDWDHLSANNFVKGKHDIARPLKDIYQQPCNFRAWPFRLNRSDQDGTPAQKLSIKNSLDSLRMALPNLSDSQMSVYLLESSFCSKSWKGFGDKWLDGSKISDRNWQGVYGLIFDRWKNMYQELSRELRMNELAIK